MNEKKGYKSKGKLQSLVTLVLLLLALMSEAVMLWSWFTILEPQLQEKAQITARALAQSRIHVIADALAAEGRQIHPEDVIKAMEAMMLITDPDTDNPLILGVELEVDYDVVKAAPVSLDLTKGLPTCQDCFATEIPIYSRDTKELLGIARFRNSTEFYRHFISDVRSKLFLVSGIVVLLFVMATFLLIFLFKKSRETEKELQEQQAQLIHAGRISAMGEMATGIAHEINQPLAIIRLAADGLKNYFNRNNKDTDSMEAKAAATIVSQVDRSVTIIQNMRSFVRRSPHGFDPIDLAEAFERAISFFREQFRIHQISLNISLAEKLPEVRINQQKFEQIVVNLLSNARYAVEEKEKISTGQYKKKIIVHLHENRDKSKVVFEVIDNGIGMNNEMRDRCLEPFYTTKEVGDGTGLGLSIVHTIVKELNTATIEIESEEGQGCLFRIIMQNE
jgi:signal transduction histidine kinase